MTQAHAEGAPPLGAQLRRFGSLVTISHSVFSLPFALASAVLASRFAEPTWWRIALIVVCVVTARSAAMAFNRLVDRRFDALNPRTATRDIPSGQVTPRAAAVLVVVTCGLFVGAAALLGPLPLALSPVALGLALGYSYTKRFTALCHVVLGAAIAIAPGGAWIALGAPVTLAPWLLVIGVALWVAGFDVLYALQDRDFDRGQGLRSIPVVLGVRGTLVLSALMHLGTIACLLGVGFVLARGAAYFLGVGVIVALLTYEHAIVKPGDLSRIDKAFFELNGYESLAFFGFVLVDRFLG
jgi:4-hydroxybenzoate polyprenyltransferase